MLLLILVIFVTGCNACSSSVPCAGNLCCSSAGYCGTTPAYCSTGCVNGPCTSGMGTCSATVLCPNNGCCSSAGYCGTTSAYCGTGCVNGPCTSGFGTCSATVPCPNNGCCSSAGYCGTTSDYCGTGCVSGPCGTCSATVPCPNNECCLSGKCGLCTTLPCIDWLIKHGSTCWSFAIGHGFNTVDFIKANPSLDCNALPLNKHVCVNLPSSAPLSNISSISAAMGSTTSTSSCPIYTIQPGDTWASIAQTVKILPSKLIAANPQMFIPGQVVTYQCNKIKSDVNTSVAVLKTQINRLVLYTASWAQYRTSKNGRSTKCDPYAYTPNHIDPNVATHINYAFVMFDKSTGIVKNYEYNDDVLIAQLVALKQQNVNLKILISIGGWNFCQDPTGDPFSVITKSSSLTTTFATSAVNYVVSHGADGIDIDWEFPTATDDFTGLLTALRNAITAQALSSGNAPLLLTAALPAGILNIVNINVNAISKILDFANIMTYDYHGGSFETWPPLPHTPVTECLKAYNVNNKIYFWSIASSLQYYLDNGMPAYMITAGLATYGRTFPANKGGTLIAGNCTAEPGILSSYEINDLFKSPNIDTFSMTANAQTSTTWVGFDTIKTMKMKMCYFASMGITNLMLFDAEEDDNLKLIKGIKSTTDCNTAYYKNIISNSKCNGTIKICEDTTQVYNANVVITPLVTLARGPDINGDYPQGVCSMIGSYGRGVGAPISSCPSNLEQSVLLCYPHCKKGFKGALNMCWGSGWDVFNSYDRGMGDLLSCAPGLSYDAGLCYVNCKKGYRGIGPVCWRNGESVDPKYPLNCGQYDLYGANSSVCSSGIAVFNTAIASGAVTVALVIAAVVLEAPPILTAVGAPFGVVTDMSIKLAKIPICAEPQKC